MKLAVLASADPLSLRTWSGIPYFMTKALQTRFPDLLTISVPRPLWFQPLRRAVRKLSSCHIDLYWSQFFAQQHAETLTRRLKASGTDVAVCIANAPLSAFLASQLSTIHISDATVPLMQDYYQEFATLRSSFKNMAWQLDSMSVLKSRACLYPTSWAARSAIQDYGAEPSRVFAIPWGANMESPDVPPVVSKPAGEVCHLVFIGVDWQRKGGEIAVAAMKHLNASGCPVKLHIVGATPKLRLTENIVVHGFVDKGTAQGRVLFDKIMRRAAFVFVPTRQDCFGMIFPEANCYGVPVISTKTGGVPDVIIEGVNGHLLPLEAPAEDYAKSILAIWSDRDLYEQLRQSARARFDQLLNWQSWVSSTTSVIEAAVGSTKPSLMPAATPGRP